MDTMIKTSVSKDSNIYKLGQQLVEAGHAYWKEYNRLFGSTAVVWLELENGHFILFTRGEYKQRVIENIDFLNNEPPIERPFE